jgi:hypothetical protein
MKRLIALVPLAVLAIPDAAEAAPRARARARGGEGIHQGGYIYGAPAIIQLPIEDDDYADLDPTWGWGFGGGYLFEPANYFKIAVGGSFEHTIYNWDDVDNDDASGNMLRLTGELRIGGGTNKVWGYGLIGPGLALSIVDVHRGPFEDYDDTDAGFNLSVGGGVQGAVWRSLFLGGELDFDLNFFPNDEDGPYWDNDYEIHQLWIKFIIGWYF